MKLRAHHVFCTAQFSGHGYDEAFTEQMKTAIEALRAGEKAELVSGPDHLCSACPNRLVEGGCAQGTENVQRRDENALKVLNLQKGDSLSWAQMGRALSAMTEETFQKVCGGCRWQREGLCSLELLLYRTKAK